MSRWRRGREGIKELEKETWRIEEGRSGGVNVD